ncbi:VOC family protein [Micromonospora sp. NPDC002575]|uniref:VOC family protein n=1 Tax=Micromonospora sp. NPDC002575 TaxID=3364222 RepID=UPI00368B5DEB
MPSPLLTVTFDAHDAVRLARFWAGLLGREVAEDARGALLPGDDTQPSLRFVPSNTEKAGPNRLHLHLTSADHADQQRLVTTALALGGGHLDVGQRPEEEHIVLADPEGNEFCVIEPGSRFLAGCGPLGELACDGTREVGLFWSEALGWPLVWDQDQETAVQSPHGGTKVAWGGPPVAPKTARNRQRLDLTPPGGDQRAEVDRLVALGATRLETDADGTVMLADPDGNEFTITPP